MDHPDAEITLTEATSCALRIRRLYNQLEEHKHGSAWTNQEDMTGLSCDIGELGRLVMAAEGRWIHDGNLPKELGDKLSECLWWILVLSERLGINLTKAFVSKTDELEAGLGSSLRELKRDS